MSKTWGIIMGAIVFCLVFVIIFEIGNKTNDYYGVSVDSRYSEKSDYYSNLGMSASGDAINISEKSPGGTEGKVGNPGEDVQVGGVRAMAQIFQAPGHIKDILLGHNSTDSGIADKVGIDPRITTVLIVMVVLTIALILIGAITRNRI